MLRKAAIVSVLSVLAAPSSWAADAVGAPPSPVFAPTVDSSSFLSRWTGFYVGGAVGAAVGSVTYGAGSGPYPGAVGQSGAASDSAFAGSLRVGYDRQLASVVVGAVVDVAANSAGVHGALQAGDGAVGFRSETPFLGTVRVRVGAMADRALVYATGGYAVGSTTGSFSSVDALGASVGGKKTAVESGWVVGAGVEYPIAQHWTTSLEYDHVALDPSGLKDVQALFFNSYRPQLDEVKAGVNYKW